MAAADNGKEQPVTAREHLHETVVEALELHSKSALPKLKLGKAGRQLVVASGNALPTGRIILEDQDAVFANEGQYRQALNRVPAIDSTVVISASGGKHAPGIVAALLERKLETFLLTCNAGSEAARLLAADHVVATESREEPFTYNVSTYLGMILAKTREDPETIVDHICQRVKPCIPDDLGRFKAFYLIVRPEFDVQREMFLTKFDELFGPKLNARCYTTSQTLHAKTLIRWDKEMFVSFGWRNTIFGDEGCRLNVPLPDKAGHAAMMAVGYYVIGQIQSQFPQWFFGNVKEYRPRQPQLFTAVERQAERKKSL